MKRSIWVFRNAWRGWVIAIAALLSSSAPATGEPFPDIDHERLQISLRRSACYGSCPDYLVTIDGTGRVVFVSTPNQTDDVSEVHRSFSRSDGVLLSGRQEDRISVEEVDQLVEQFRKAEFFAFKDEYTASVTDNPTKVLTIDTGHGRKQVIDYVGREAGMPEAVTELQLAVDRLAGTARWVDGAPGLIEWLDDRGFDFTSDEAAEMAAEGAFGDAAEETLLGFIEHGVPLTERVRQGRGSRPVGEALIDGALWRGLPELFAKLVELGWLERFGASKAARVFANRAGGCNATMVQAVTDAGIAIDAPDEEGQTALAALAADYRCDDDRQRVAMAERLLDQGADPNRRDDDGETAIFGVESSRLLELLYARGADGTIKDHDGNSAVFSSWTDDIVLLHLQHGASPVGHYYDHRSLREQMRERPMPKSERWLADHGL
jgi:hypothetical protein